MTQPSSPYTYPRIIRWGDCDPAGIAYTPRIFDCLTEALEAWHRDILGVDWLRLRTEMGMGAPIVHAEADMVRPLPPDLVLDIEVRVEEVGTASVTYALSARGPSGDEHFRGRMVACYIDAAAERAAPMPESLRQRLLANSE